MIRFLDIIFSLIGLIIFSPLFLILYLLIFLENGNPLFFQRRVGKNLKVFVLVKFRTMKIDTPSKGTHLIKKSSITFIGSILRTTKIDEFPQLWNILKGDLSLVGPRPCLENQKKLISERKKKKFSKFDQD